MTNHAKSHYNHGRQQLARDVAEVELGMAAEQEVIAESVRLRRERDAALPVLTRPDVEGAEYIRLRGRNMWLAVIRVSQRTVTVLDYGGLTYRAPMKQIAEVQR